MPKPKNNQIKIEYHVKIINDWFATSEAEKTKLILEKQINREMSWIEFQKYILTHYPYLI